MNLPDLWFIYLQKTQQKSTSSQQTKSSQTSSVGKSSTLINIVKPPLKLQKRPHTSRDDTRKDDSFTSYLNNEYPPYNPSDFALAQTEDQSEFTLDRSVRKQNPQTYSDKQDLLKKIREELSLWTAGSSMEKKKSCPEQWTSAPPESMYLPRPLPQSMLHSKMHFCTNVYYFLPLYI